MLPMSGEEDWDEPKLFLAEQTRTIRHEFAVLAIPVLLVVAALCVLGAGSRERPQLAASAAHALPIADQR